MSSFKSENEINAPSHVYAWTYWLEPDAEGRLYLWSECLLPSGERKAHGSPITLDQLNALHNSTDGRNLANEMDQNPALAGQQVSP